MKKTRRLNKLTHHENNKQMSMINKRVLLWKQILKTLCVYFSICPQYLHFNLSTPFNYIILFKKSLPPKCDRLFYNLVLLNVVVLVKVEGGSVTTHPPTGLVQGWRSLQSLALFLNSAFNHVCWEIQWLRLFKEWLEPLFDSTSEKWWIKKQSATKALEIDQCQIWSV